MSRRRQLSMLGGIALLIVSVTGAVTLLNSSGSTGASTDAAHHAVARAFLTAAAVPQGLGARPVPAFTLRDAAAGRFSSTSLDGRPYALTFLYTHCVDVCPLIGSEIQQALAKLGRQAGSLSVVAISVDPRGDTRLAVRRWLQAHQEPANFHYLIGSPRELGPVWKAFYVSPQTPGDPHGTHSAVIWLVNRTGRPAALIPAGRPINVEYLTHDLKVLLDAQ
jgi:protein SCO1/2